MLFRSVVDPLEIVHVDKDEEEGFAGAIGKTERLLREKIEAAPVVEARQFIAGGEFTDCGFEAFATDGKQKDEAEGNERQQRRRHRDGVLLRQ